MALKGSKPFAHRILGYISPKPETLNPKNPKPSASHGRSFTDDDITCKLWILRPRGWGLSLVCVMYEGFSV